MSGASGRETLDLRKILIRPLHINEEWSGTEKFDMGRCTSAQLTDNNVQALKTKAC